MRHIFLLFLGLFCTPLMAAPKVVATYPPIHSLVAGVMEDVSKVTLLNTRPYADHHQYELKPSEMKLLRNADVVFWVGPELETFLPPALSEMAPHALSVPLMEQTPDLLLLPKANGQPGKDAHIWMDPDNALKMLDTIEKVLSEKDPANAAKYRAGALKAKEHVEALREIKNTAKGMIVSLHGGFPYMFDFFHIEGEALGVDLQRLSGPKSIAQVQDRLKALNPACVIIDPGMKKREVKLLTGDRYRTIMMDVMGWNFSAGPGLYTNMMRRNFGRLIKCLEK